MAHGPQAPKSLVKLPWHDPGEALPDLFPSYNDTRLEVALRERQESTLLNPFVKLMQRMARGELSPRLHAEVVLLNHFKQANLAFIGGERYLGCSKAPCYCWDLYIRHHPGGYVARPCLGNIWAKWAAPDLYYEE